MKINFAQRVIVKIVPKATASGASSELKNELQTLINSSKVNIDRSVFAKTQSERNELKIAKLAHKAMLLKSK